uniref:Uncharacterized protein n=1 Tax=viral metagenome TaxID=1070528 RepID=A0A6M3KPZ4_9ZZZZ
MRSVQEILNLVVEDSGGNALSAQVSEQTVLNLVFDATNNALRVRVNGPIRMPAQTSAPSDPTAGAICLADRANWDPLGLGSGGAYLTMYLGAASGWGAITDQLD